MTASTNRAVQRQLFKVLRILLTIVLLYWVLNRVGFVQVFDTLREADPWLLGTVILFYQGGVVVRTIRWWVLLHGSGIRTRFGVILGLSYIGQFFNVALPTGFAGDVVRAVEFKDSDAVATSAGIVILDRMLGLLTLFAVALVALALGHRMLSPTTALALTAISLVGFIVLIFILRGDLMRRLSPFLPKQISAMGEGWWANFYQALTKCASASVRLALALSLLNTVLTVAIHYVVARAVGVQLGIGLFFIFTPIVNLSLLLPTISGLGLREVGYQILLSPLGVPGDVAVALGIGIYLTNLSTALPGGVYHLIWSARR